jgi:hypothetical protein
MVVNPTTGDVTTLGFAVPDIRLARIAGGLRARWGGSARLRLIAAIDASIDVTKGSGDRQFLAMTADGTTVVGLPLDRPAWGLALSIGGQFQVGP